MSKDVTVTCDNSPGRPALQAAVRGPLSNLLALTIQQMLDRGELAVIGGVITRPGQMYAIELALPVEADVERP